MKSVHDLLESTLSMAKSRSQEEARKAFGMGIAAGAYVALAGAAVIAFSSNTAGLPGGLTAFLSGLIFCAGLAMVLCAGGELFTGNCLMPLGWLNRSVSVSGVLKNWGVVYVGNLVGSLLIVGLIWGGGFLIAGDGSLSKFGARVVAIATAKANLTFVQGFCRGVLCNWLVALAVWIGFAGESVTDKIVGLVFPISIFVLSGYEHCVANMFFLPSGMVAQFLNPTGFGLVCDGILRNMIAVTLGNFVGGALFVACLYGWTLGLKKNNLQ